MRAPYGLAVLDTCVTLSSPLGTPLLQFAGACRSEAERDQIHRGLPEIRDAVYRGPAATWGFVLCDVLGLNATISNRPYEVMPR